MKKRFFFLPTLTVLLSVTVWNCNFNPQETESIKRGSTSIAADESLKPIIDAEVAAYQAHYPETKFKVIYVPEQEAINLMLKDSVAIAATTRELTAAERVYYEKTRIKYEPAPMALDAVALIVNKSSNLEKISLTELRELFSNKNNSRQLVFDNSNSSNLTYIKNLLQLDDIKGSNVAAANGNADVFSFIARNPNSIGVIGNNWISDQDNKEAVELKKSVRVLAVSKTTNDPAYTPTLQNLRDRNYPLERLIYLHTNSNIWGVAKGFIRFCCSQIGQLVVEKMDLIPYYVIPKVYVMDDNTVKEMQTKKD